MNIWGIQVWVVYILTGKQPINLYGTLNWVFLKPITSQNMNPLTNAVYFFFFVQVVS